MNWMERAEILLSWSPYLAEGFAVNIMISAVAMTFGTIAGVGVGRLRGGSAISLKGLGDLLTAISRNVPSFVLMFYLAFLLPNEFSWRADTIAVPTWIKATMALTIPVIGFCSDQFSGGIKSRGAGLDRVFWIAWVQYFLIIVMASATASVIGADEIVRRINVVVAIQDEPGFLIMAYCYVALWFILFGAFFKACFSAARKMFEN